MYKDFIINSKQKNMKNVILLFTLMALTAIAYGQSDKNGCKDHPLIPTRIPNYYISDCENNEFSTHTVVTTMGEKTVEGKKTVLQYALKPGFKGVSETFVKRNYIEALKKQNGKVMFESSGRGVVMVKRPNGSEVWVDVNGYSGDGSPEETGLYWLYIIEIAPMEQVISASDLSKEINNTGKVTLYIQFETGKSDIKPESVPIIEQMAKMLNSNKQFKVFIVGHTDNAGTLEANLKLSEDRAKAVTSMLTSKFNVSPTQIMAKGVGPLAPIANNDSEDGRRLNRRVEMVKQ